MPSNEHVEPLDDLIRDVALTPEQSKQLWDIRKYNRMTPEEYLHFLNTLTKDKPPSRDVPPLDATPFEL